MYPSSTVALVSFVVREHGLTLLCIIIIISEFFISFGFILYLEQKESHHFMIDTV